MNERVVRDLSGLEPSAMGSGNVSWWGNLAFMLIEGAAFALAVMVYLYLASIAAQWPLGAPRPDLGPGLVFTALLLASLVPNALMLRYARRLDLRKVRLLLPLMAVLTAALLGVRVLEFGAFHARWDQNAYGSIVWLLLSLHTTHLLTDMVEAIVLVALMWTRHGDSARRFGDIQDNAVYWNFVAAAWLPIYACLYGVPWL